LDTTGSKILVVDDDPVSRHLAVTILNGEGYELEEAENGIQALECVRRGSPDMVLLDVMMPDMNGFDVAQALKSDKKSEDIPIIMITSLADSKSRELGFLRGVEEYITKPINHVELKTRVRNLLRLKQLNNVLKHHNELLEEEVRLRGRELQNSFEEGIYSLMRASEYRDDKTGEHIRRISFYTQLLAEVIGMDREYCRTIFLASPMHDIGKIGIPDHILQKPGMLTQQEWRVMETHTTIGEKILEGGYSPYIKMGKEIALSHHERWDGSGYPRGIAGEAIPHCARIMSICDVYDALRSERPYKGSIEHAEAVEIIRHGDGRTHPTHFDPEILDAFVRMDGVFNDIFESMCN